MSLFSSADWKKARVTSLDMRFHSGLVAARVTRSLIDDFETVGLSVRIAAKFSSLFPSTHNLDFLLALTGAASSSFSFKIH